MPDRILVTGASGFIAGHTIIELLNHGYRVRGSVRNLALVDGLLKVLIRHHAGAADIEWVQADLTESDGWQDAVRGCDGVFHMASPVPLIQPGNEDDVIVPARQGTMLVLEAAQKYGIKRVVLTSSIDAVSSGHRASEYLLTAADWSNPDNKSATPYAKSKTIAERCAWDFVADIDLERVASNPALVVWPALDADYGSSLEALAKLLKGKVPLLPRLGFVVVYVRGVARLHRLSYEYRMRGV